MDSEGREDLVVIVAGLLGVLVGYAVRRAMRNGSSTDDRFGVVGASTLIATPSLARIAGDALAVDRADVGKQAALSLVVGALLTAFADEISGLLPTLRGGARAKG